MITKIAEKITFNVGDDDKNKTPWGSIAMGGAGLAGLGYLGYNKFWKPRAEANAALDAYKKMTTKGGSKWLGRGIKGLGALGALGGIGLMGYNYANGNDMLDFSPVTNAWNSAANSGQQAMEDATQAAAQPTAPASAPATTATTNSMYPATLTPAQIAQNSAAAQFKTPGEAMNYAAPTDYENYDDWYNQYTANLQQTPIFGPSNPEVGVTQYPITGLVPKVPLSTRY